jgi:hypothetical protein
MAIHITEALEIKLRNAERAQLALKAEREAAVSAATNEVHANYADPMHAANLAVAVARDALTAHISATATHPWDGKRVFRMVTVGRVWENRGKKREDGLVEVVRSDSVFAGNLSPWYQPRVGQVIVRQIKKDGTPSLKFHQSYRDIQDSWQLVEGQD